MLTFFHCRVDDDYYSYFNICYFYYPYFTGQSNEAQKGCVPSPRPQNYFMGRTQHSLTPPQGHEGGRRGQGKVIEKVEHIHRRNPLQVPECVDQVMTTLFQEHRSCISDWNRSQVTRQWAEKPTSEAGEVTHERSGKAWTGAVAEGRDKRNKHIRYDGRNSDKVGDLVGVGGEERNIVKKESKRQ